ncbi:MAG: peptide-methionine (S)-S-oxide reductase MsrA [Woeseiaceae bacterium]|nr:peptide-methionine (S)-S-oxide reductase MsrA [Woeseiaceae bacterium]
MGQHAIDPGAFSECGRYHRPPTPRRSLPSLMTMHFVNGNPIAGPFASHLQEAVFALGCFWGAERRFWETDGVFTTVAGYAGGSTADPDYKLVCGGSTGHAEVVLVVFDPDVVSYEELLRIFWESHNPTQGMRQGNDIGTQYRSAIYTYNDEQVAVAQQSMRDYQAELTNAGYGDITTEVKPLNKFYYAEDYHQQYLAKNPNGYCGLGGTGVSCSIGLGD